MVIRNTFKYLILALFVTVVAGCDSTPDKEQGSSAADAIAAAKAANKRAINENYEWRDTGKIIKKAEKALAGGDDAKAIKLANKARRQAENAVKQKFSELKRLEHMLGAAPVAQVTQSDVGEYSVVQGDNLWDISAKSDVYGNPYQWPLIYKVNRSKIKDADLIYPGQQFAIDSNVSSDDVSEAVAHAKSRGSWSLGTVEASDSAYLDQ
ncbi:MAG: LysM peptidoglycan-binding domain-containing protein [Gammaproteobacteria bacterium]